MAWEKEGVCLRKKMCVYVRVCLCECVFTKEKEYARGLLSERTKERDRLREGERQRLREGRLGRD